MELQLRLRDAVALADAAPITVKLELIAQGVRVKGYRGTKTDSVICPWETLTITTNLNPLLFHINQVINALS